MKIKMAASNTTVKAREKDNTDVFMIMENPHFSTCTFTTVSLRINFTENVFKLNKQTENQNNNSLGITFGMVTLHTKCISLLSPQKIVFHDQ